jgi:hypothetical protein
MLRAQAGGRLRPLSPLNMSVRMTEDSFATPLLEGEERAEVARRLARDSRRGERERRREKQIDR